MLVMFKPLIVFINTFSALSLLNKKNTKTLSVSIYMFFILYLTMLFALLAALVSDNFQILYVAQHSHPDLPWYFKLASLWAGHEGSITLILLFMSWHTLIYLKEISSDNQEFFLKISLVNLILLSLYSLVFSYPLETQLSFMATPPQDLNPILKHYALTYHPPLLLYGMISFFPISLGWLLEGSSITIHKKIYLGLGILTIGITFGSYWAYHVLGWGGWWFWDPVETISLFPCFMGMAMLHGKTRISKFVGFLTWPLILIGFLLIRTDAISSVHAFSQQSVIGYWIGSLLLINLLIALKLASPKFEFEIESFKKLRGLCTLGLYAITIVSLASLLIPIILKKLFHQHIFIGPTFYNQVLASILCGLFTLLVTKKIFSEKVSWFLGCLIFLLFMWPADPLFLTGILSALFIASLRFSSSPGSFSHQLSLLLMLLIALQSVLKKEEDYIVSPGQTKTTSWGTLTLEKAPKESLSSYESIIEGTVKIQYVHGPAITLSPVIKIHETQKNLTTELATYPHLYWETGVLLMQGQNPNTWIIKYYFKPFLRSIWLVLLILSGLWCFRGLKNEVIQ